MMIDFQGTTYEEIVEKFRWRLPADFNIGVACCDAMARSDSERVALRKWERDGGRRETTYGELKDLSDRLAAGLAALGATAGDRIAIVLPQSLETAVTHLAVYKSAMIAVPLARLFGSDALEYRLQKAGASIVVTNRDGEKKIEAIRANLPELRHVIVTDTPMAQGNLDWRQVLENQSQAFEPVLTSPDTPALIIFTSGTTGPPKGALHGHKVLIGHLPGLKIHHEFMPQPGDMAWTPADWAWAGGLLNILLPCLIMGVPVVYGGLDRFDPGLAFRLMEEMEVANAFIPPTALRLMKSVYDTAGRPLVRLRTVGTGGESLGEETHRWAERELGIRINEFYGQTECNLVLSCAGAAGVMRAGSIGKPVPGHAVAIIDEKGEECPAQERGEVAIRRPDPVMFLEYWQDPVATREKFLDDWMLTGDQAVVDADGYYHFVGRDDDIINVSGYRVGPGEIENCLISHPAVRLAAAVGKPDPVKGEIVKAYVVLADGMAGTEDLAAEIQAYVKERVAANIFPKELAFVETIPLTTTGKVIRRLFRQQAAEEAAEEAAGELPG